MKNVVKMAPQDGDDDDKMAPQDGDDDDDDVENNDVAEGDVDKDDDDWCQGGAALARLEWGGGGEGRGGGTNAGRIHTNNVSMLAPQVLW